MKKVKPAKIPAKTRAKLRVNLHQLKIRDSYKSFHLHSIVCEDFLLHWDTTLERYKTWKSHTFYI
jgi:hypothetical protein